MRRGPSFCTWIFLVPAKEALLPYEDHGTQPRKTTALRRSKVGSDTEMSTGVLGALRRSFTCHEDSAESFETVSAPWSRTQSPRDFGN